MKLLEEEKYHLISQLLKTKIIKKIKRLNKMIRVILKRLKILRIKIIIIFFSM